MNNIFDNINSYTRHPVIWKYFPELNFPEGEIDRFRELIGISVENIAELNRLIENYGLNNWKEVLVIIFCHLGIEWHHKDLMSRLVGIKYKTEHDHQLKLLKDFFKNFNPNSKRKIIRVMELKIGLGKKEIKITNQLLLERFKYFVKFYAFKKFIESRSPIKILIKEEKGSYVKRYVQDKLKKLFNFLETETILKGKDKKEICVFIEEFTTLGGMDWKQISTNPLEYIRQYIYKANS